MRPRFKKILYTVAIALVVFATASALLMWRFARLQADRPEQIGVTFSQEQAERFGSNWRDNYMGLLDDLGFRHIRIVAYWDRVEKSPGQYDFSETDWMIDQAARHGAKVTVVIGQRTLRYPECFYPSWLDTKNTKEVSSRVRDYISAVATHYHNESAIDAWQLENEFLLTEFGGCPRANMGSRNLNIEYQTLRRADSAHPVVITASDEFGLPVFGPTGETYGFSMYKIVWNQLTKRGYFTYRQPGAYNWWRAAWISFIFRTDIRIHELQAEPWGPVGNEHLDSIEAAKSMNSAQLTRNIDYARSTHIKDMDLWGAEWWWYMKQARGDHSMWEAVRAELAKNIK